MLRAGLVRQHFQMIACQALFGAQGGQCGPGRAHELLHHYRLGDGLIFDDRKAQVGVDDASPFSVALNRSEARSGRRGQTIAKVAGPYRGACVVPRASIHVLEVSQP